MREIRKRNRNDNTSFGSTDRSEPDLKSYDESNSEDYRVEYSDESSIDNYKTRKGKRRSRSRDKKKHRSSRDKKMKRYLDESSYTESSQEAKRANKKKIQEDSDKTLQPKFG